MEKAGRRPKSWSSSSPPLLLPTSPSPSSAKGREGRERWEGREGGKVEPPPESSTSTSPPLLLPPSPPPSPAAHRRRTQPRQAAAVAGSQHMCQLYACPHARTHACAHACMRAHAHTAQIAHAAYAHTHARTYARTHARWRGSSAVDEGGTCARIGLGGTRARQRTGCRAWVCGGAACSAARPGLGRSGQPVVQAALSSCWHLCSVSKHGRRRECVGYAGRAARRRSVPEVAAVRGDDVVML